MSSLASFVLGVLITIVVSVLAPFSTSPIQRWWATRNKKRGLQLIKALEAERIMIETLHKDQLRLLRFIGLRILWLTIWWIAQSLLDVLFGFIINGFDVAHSTFSYTIFPVNTDFISNWLSAIASLVDAIFLVILFRVGVHSYRIVRYVMNFDEYLAKVQRNISLIKEKNKLLDEPSEDDADATAPERA